MSHRPFALPGRTAAAAAVAATCLGFAAAPAPAANQEGLVNVSVTDNTVQVPIGIAANVCDVTVAVLSTGTFTGNDLCTAVTPVTATG